MCVRAGRTLVCGVVSARAPFPPFHPLRSAARRCHPPSQALAGGSAREVAPHPPDFGGACIRTTIPCRCLVGEGWAPGAPLPPPPPPPLTVPSFYPPGPSLLSICPPPCLTSSSFYFPVPLRAFSLFFPSIFHCWPVSRFSHGRYRHLRGRRQRHGATPPNTGLDGLGARWHIDGGGGARHARHRSPCRRRRWVAAPGVWRGWVESDGWRRRRPFRRPRVGWGPRGGRG